MLAPVRGAVGVTPGAPARPGARDDGAHAVPGTGYTVVDMDDRGSAMVALDGSGSHTHNSGGGKATRSATALGPESGYGGIVAMTWSVGRVVIGTGVSPTAIFPVGTTTVLLTVKDWTGDVHAATTKVVVRGDTTPGLWCYYTPAGAAGGKPTVAAGATTIWFAGPAAFGGAPFARGAGGWTARCVGSYRAERVGRVTFAILLTGGTVKLSVGRRSLALTRVPWSELTRKVTTSLPAGLHPVELTYTRRAGAKGNPSLRLNVLPSLLSHQSRTRLPVVSAASPASGALAGGARLTLIGNSLARTSLVTVGGRRAKIVAAPTAREQQASEAIRATVLVPPGIAAGSVDVVLTTPAGVSNPVKYTYLAGRAAPDMIAWRTSTLKTADGSEDFKVVAGTTGALGPDRRLYVGCTAGGRLYRLDVDWLTYRVQSACSVWLGGQILGVSFNPADVGRAVPRVYVSIADISKGAPWTGGRVLRLLSVGRRACFGPATTVVSGLPVQVGHDHSIGRPAYTQQGDMLLPVGGVTNVGIPHPASGSLDESPLSAAIVKVPLSKRNFNGRITYSTNNASTARVTGGDVQVWASGVRNGLNLVRHSMSDTFWILDNGPNFGYGDVSETCSVTAPMDKDANPLTRRDKLLRVAEGGYYGHPNRNRGRDDPRQCTYHLPMAKAPGYTPALAYFEPSSNGTLRYFGRFRLWGGGGDGTGAPVRFALCSGRCHGACRLTDHNADLCFLHCACYPLAWVLFFCVFPSYCTWLFVTFCFRLHRHGRDACQYLSGRPQRPHVLLTLRVGRHGPDHRRHGQSPGCPRRRRARHPHCQVLLGPVHHN